MDNGQRVVPRCGEGETPGFLSRSCAAFGAEMSAK